MPDWSNFKETDRQQWMLQASQEAKGNTDIRKLAYQLEGFGGFSPFLTADEAFFLPSVDTHATLPGVHIVEKTASRANEIALRMLERGASCLWFHVGENWNLEDLLAGIYIEMVPVILDVPLANGPFCADLQTFLQQLSPEAAANILIAGNREIQTHQMIRLDALQDFRSRSHQIHQAMQLREVENEKALLLVIELKPDFFAQVAELRFIHQLNQRQDLPNPVFVIAKTSPVKEEWSEIHPLIPVTYQLLSAHLGMAHAAFGMDTSMGDELSRISLHCQHILQQEGKTGMVSDPLAGSYLTDQIMHVLERSKISALGD